MSENNNFKLFTIDWEKKKVTHLPIDIQERIVGRIRRMAKDFPKGFDLSFSLGMGNKENIINFLKCDVDILFVEVGESSDSFTLAFYKSCEDMVEREVKR